jgi:predicted permease
MALVNRLLGLFRRIRVEQDLNEELQHHIELKTQEYIDAGISPEEARHAALHAFGGLEQRKEECRDADRVRWVEDLMQDLRYGLRQLRRSPGFTTVAVITLALGIGANTAIFSLIDAVMLRNLPVRKPAQLVLLSDNSGQGMSIWTGLEGNGRWTEFSYPLYEDFVRRNQGFLGICAFQSGEDDLAVRFEGSRPGKGTQLAFGTAVSGNYFQVLGVNAIIGRALTPADDQPPANPVAVASFNYWKSKLGRNAGVVGRSVDINGVPATLVGVMPPGFFGQRVEAGSADLWLPITLRPRILQSEVPWAKQFVTDSDTEWLNLIGRLKPGVSLAQANAEIDGQLQQYISGLLGTRIRQDEREQLSHQYVTMVPGGRGLSTLRHIYPEPLQMLLTVVALVLLIACANVANLLFSRATSRKKEMATRMAVGATRGRLIRQMFAECALMVILGGAAGALLAAWVGHIIVSLVAPNTPLSLKPNLYVLTFTVGVSLLTVVLAGLAPALRATRVELVSAFKAGSASATSQRSRLGLTKQLVIFQIAVTLVLLVGASLLLRSLANLEEQNLGFNPKHVLLVSMEPALAGYKPRQLPVLYGELVNRISSLPGVRSASVGDTSPMGGVRQSTDVSIDGEFRHSGEDDVRSVGVGPRYFETLEMPLIAGRAFGTQDTLSSTAVAIVNQAFADRFLPGRNPLGHQFSFGSKFKAPGLEIVGVVGNARYSSPREKAGPALFVPVNQLEGEAAYANEIEIRAAGNAADITEEVRRAIHGIDSNLPVTNFTPLSDQVNDSLRQPRLISELTGCFGLLALVLACVGLYGVMTYDVTRKTNEIGIRIALGAGKGDVLKIVIGKGLKQVLVGVIVGIAGALALTRFLSSLLFGVKPTDPLTFAIATLILAAVALVACYIPARRAAKVDPMVALRYE